MFVILADQKTEQFIQAKCKWRKKKKHMYFIAVYVNISGSAVFASK